METHIGTDLGEAARLLRDGGMVAMPTETVYGLAANAFDVDAVLQIFEVKDRPRFDPLIVHIGHQDQLHDVVREIPAEAQRLIAELWPGPLTLVLPKAGKIPELVTSGLDTVAVRMPAHSMALELLRKLAFPLAAPSANPFGYVSPTTAQHVWDQLNGRIPYILDGGACSVGVESTIIGWEGGEMVIYRPGGVSIEKIQNVTGIIPERSRLERPVAPGMHAFHYAPRKPLLVGSVPSLLQEHTGRRIGVISFSTRHPAAISEVLSPEADLHESARELFAAIRRLDASDVDLIIAEIFPEEGLGRAINDRLQRAAYAASRYPA